MKQFLITVAGVFAGLLLFLIGVPFLLIAMVAGAARPAADRRRRRVLELDLRERLTDQEPQNPLAALRPARRFGDVDRRRPCAAPRPTTGSRRCSCACPKAASTPAAADELRLAFKHFRAAGKPVIAHSQGLYPSGVVTSTYMLGAAARRALDAAGRVVPGDRASPTRTSSSSASSTSTASRPTTSSATSTRTRSTATSTTTTRRPTARPSCRGWARSTTPPCAAAAADRKTQPAGAARPPLEAGPYGAEDAQAKGLIDKVGQVREAEQPPCSSGRRRRQDGRLRATIAHGRQRAPASAGRRSR